MKFTKREVATGGGNEKYLKWKDGESKTLILRGEVYEFYMKWVNGKGMATTADDPEKKSRFKANAIIADGGNYSAKIWEFPLTVYNKLADINLEYALETTAIKVTRQGMGTDTEYHLLPLLKVKIPQSLDRIEMNILNTAKSASGTLSTTPTNGWDQAEHIEESELPF